MKFSTAFCALSALSVSLLPAQITSPVPGFARFADGSLCAIHGLPANLVVTPQDGFLGAQSASFSDAGGILFHKGTLRVVTPNLSIAGEYVTNETTPVLDMGNSLESAVAYLPSKHLIVRWAGTAFSAVEIDDSSFGGRVGSLRFAAPNTATMYVIHADSQVSAVTVSLATGVTVSSTVVPGAYGQALPQFSSLVSESPRGLVVESANGNSRELPLLDAALPPGDLTIERMSTNWLHISSASTGADWALYLNEAHLALSILPQPPPARPKSTLIRMEHEK